MKQFLCSHLVTLKFPAHETGANLERIWPEGATVNSEEPVSPGTRVTIVSASCELRGSVTACEEDPLGNFLDIEFDSEWSPDLFAPDHMISVP